MSAATSHRARPQTAEPDPIALAAIARGLEDEGRNLAARLFRAAARSEETRRTHERPRSNEDIATAIDEVVPRLAATGHASELVSAMRQVATMLRSGNERFERDMADLHVCRYCGNEMLGERLERCPSCGSGPLSFEQVPPIYLLQTVPTEILLPALAAFPGRVAQVCAGAAEAPAAAGEWPLAEIVSHLLGAQRLLGGRAIRTLAEDEPELRSVLATAVTAAADRRPDLDELLAEFRTERDALVARFSELRADQWQRIGHHAEWGPMTIQRQLSFLARHDHIHLGDLETAAGGLAVVGRRRGLRSRRSRARGSLAADG